LRPYNIMLILLAANPNVNEEAPNKVRTYAKNLLNSHYSVARQLLQVGEPDGSRFSRFMPGNPFGNRSWGKPPWR
jgi:hypothetical protein